MLVFVFFLLFEVILLINFKNDQENQEKNHIHN